MLNFLSINLEGTLSGYAELYTREQGRRGRGQEGAHCEIVSPNKRRRRIRKKDDNKSLEGKEVLNNEKSSEER
jgi:hypothetical protein